MSATRHAETVEEAAAHLRELVERAQRGETTDLVVEGRPVARIVAAPDALIQRREALDGMRRIREQLRAEGQAFTTEEIVELKNEGRR